MKFKYLHVFILIIMLLLYFISLTFNCAFISLIVGHSYNGGVS